MHDELDRETLKLLEQQHRRRALALRGKPVRVLVLIAPCLAEPFTGVLQTFEPDDLLITLEGKRGLRQVFFDRIVDIRFIENDEIDGRARSLGPDLFRQLEVLADLLSGFIADGEVEADEAEQCEALRQADELVNRVKVGP